MCDFSSTHALETWAALQHVFVMLDFVTLTLFCANQVIVELFVHRLFVFFISLPSRWLQTPALEKNNGSPRATNPAYTPFLGKAQKPQRKPRLPTKRAEKATGHLREHHRPELIPATNYHASIRKWIKSKNKIGHVKIDNDMTYTTRYDTKLDGNTENEEEGAEGAHARHGRTLE